jgi:osmotically-inducible protein OsmY
MPVVRPDTVVRRAVEAELRCHPDLDETNMLVRVEDGVVTLFGYAHNLFHKYGAEEAAKRVAGVAAVVNEMELYCSPPRHGVPGTRI